MSIVYIPILLLMLASLIAILRNKMIMGRKMLVFHIVVWQLILVCIPDIRQALGADVSIIDYVFSQSSGNVACFSWLTASYVWALRKKN